MEKNILVIGGGIAGIQASLDLADRGIKVILVEKEPTLGGKMARLDKTFPTNDCSACIFSPKLADCIGHPNIRVLTYSEVVSVDGEPGSFKVKISTKPRYVDMDNSTGCGDCIEKCPTKNIPDQFEFGLTTRKAIYIPHAQAVPRVALIDPDHCKMITKGKCGICSKVCKRHAINYEDKEKTTEVEVCSIICATGFEFWDPHLATEYGYGRFKNVVASYEYERFMSAAGPTGGHILVPSTGKEPKKIAFVQCCGSRNEKNGWKPYCSSVCCMYATKQAIIGTEHMNGVEEHIFFMDIRAFGKEFEDYVKRAGNEYGIKMHRSSRVSNIEEDPATGELIISHCDAKGDPVSERFDMAVLSIGMRASPSGMKLAKILGIDLNEHGFCKTNVYDPLCTSRDGIFVTGAFAAPKDIPTSVAEASGAAAKAGRLAVGKDFTRAKPKEFPPEKDVSGKEPRIGVWVCSCGINIGSVVDVKAVRDYAATLPNVVFATNAMYTCAQDTLTMIADTIKEKDLNRVVVASCTPRTHEPLFRTACQNGGLNPYLFEMANIRDQCSWIHMHEPEAATRKAKDLVRMAVAKSRLLEPLYKENLPVKQSALVIGGGISGMTAALDVANQGFHVDLVENTDRLGGMLNNMSHSEEGTKVSDFVKATEGKVRSNPNITVHMGTNVSEANGFVGNFGIKLSDGTETEVGAIIIATGAKEYVPTEYRYGKDDRIMTNHDLERVLESGSRNPGDTAFIQCVGSRNKEAGYCSRVCCATAIRNAIELKTKYPENNVYIIHKDIRTYGFREELYRRASELGIIFLRREEDDDPVLEPGDDLVLDVNDVTLGDKVSLHLDSIVLSNGIRPDRDANGVLAQMLKIPLSKDGFFFEAHQKLRPVDFATEGIFFAGLAHWPKFMDESMAQASGAASRALTIISKDYIASEGIVSHVNTNICDGCGTCEPICPYHAITMVVGPDGKKKANVNSGVCKGCGACVAACPSGALEQRGFTNSQILAMVEAALEEVDL